MTLSKVSVRLFFGLGALLVGVFIIIWINLSGQINKEFRESIPYKLSIDYIKNDKEIRNLIGEDMVFGKRIGGHLTPNSEARLVFKVKGYKSSTRAVCIIEYMSGDWEINSITYE
ncbi:MAG: hypothetical protein ACJAVN_002008 [Roseivirga sp.]|jgi:hypothetical protein